MAQLVIICKIKLMRKIKRSSAVLLFFGGACLRLAAGIVAFNLLIAYRDKARGMT